MSDNVVMVIVCLGFGLALLAIKDLLFGYKNDIKLPEKCEKLKGKD